MRLQGLQFGVYHRSAGIPGSTWTLPNLAPTKAPKPTHEHWSLSSVAILREEFCVQVVCRAPEIYLCSCWPKTLSLNSSTCRSCRVNRVFRVLAYFTRSQSICMWVYWDTVIWLHRMWAPTLHFKPLGSPIPDLETFMGSSSLVIWNLKV